MTQGGQEKTFRILNKDGTDYGGSCIGKKKMTDFRCNETLILSTLGYPMLTQPCKHFH